MWTALNIDVVDNMEVLPSEVTLRASSSAKTPQPSDNVLNTCLICQPPSESKAVLFLSYRMNQSTQEVSTTGRCFTSYNVMRIIRPGTQLSLPAGIEFELGQAYIALTSYLLIIYIKI
jgi:hypothetical protein